MNPAPSPSETWGTRLITGISGKSNAPRLSSVSCSLFLQCPIGAPLPLGGRRIKNTRGINSSMEMANTLITSR
jgi:hypothetical protein